MSHRRKRVCLAVMILAGLALFVDRFVLSDSVTAADQAHASSTGSSARPVDSLALAAEEMPAVPELPFPRAVERFTFDSEIPDLFAPPPQALSPDSKPPGVGDQDVRLGGGAKKIELNHAAFKAQHELRALLVHERLKIAIVNGQLMRIGDSLNGCTLARISGNTACFECDDGEAVLRTGRGGDERRD